MGRDEHQPLDYKTHILIGVHASGVMTVMCSWPYVPRQAEVQEQIDATRENYETFVLSTPTSILPGNNHASSGANRKSPRSIARG